MQSMCTTTPVLFLILLGSAHAAGANNGDNPLSKTIELLDSLAAKVTADRDAEAKAFKEYFDWCDEATRNLKFDIKTATSQKAKLEAQIAELTSDIEVCSSKIEELSGSIASDAAELKNATSVREKENLDFKASEAELEDIIDTLGRASAIISREMEKNPAALAQIDTSSFTSAMKSLETVVNAAAFTSSDRQKLVALIQSQQEPEDDDSALDLNAPAAAVYKTHSGGILDVLADLQEKSEQELSDLRKDEGNAAHNFAMLKQSLEDQMAADTKDMDEEKAHVAEATEEKAAAEGNLDVTTKELASAKASLEETTNSCMQVATDHQTTADAFAEELKVIAQAISILKDTSGGAVEQSYSFLQLRVSSKMQSRADLANSEVLAMVKKLAQRHHSAALAQLASQIAAVVRYGAASGDDPFAKVKTLITDLISKLEAEAEAEATEKAYCDEQFAKTNAKKAELSDDIAKLTAKIDKDTANSAALKEEVQELQGELAALAKLQAEMDQMRRDQNAAYVQAKADLEQGLAGVRQALTVLRDYFASPEGAEEAALLQQPEKPKVFAKETGAGNSIIGVLEVVESDFAKNLATEETEEAAAQADYEKTTQENKVTKTMKEQDVKYKTQEAAALDKAISEDTADREGLNTELSAVLEYLEKLTDRCVAKPETYEERKARRTAEIEGLKQALEILENETAFVQRKRRSNMRGSLSL